jgi:prepilin peptidase CpaA
MTPHHFVIRILVTVIVLTAAAIDLQLRKIPNWLTLSGVCAGLGVNWILYGWAGLRVSATGTLLGFGAYFALYCLGAMGAGDVKLMAAVGAMLGPKGWLAVFIATSIAGGILALALVVWNGRVRETLWNTFFIVQELAHFRAPFKRRRELNVKDPRALNLPHAVAIGTGTMACLLFAVI